MKNIVLIGMPGCGKTTVGRILSRRLFLPLVDTDALVEQAAGRSIPEIFAAEGEEAFRVMETAAARQAASMEGVVIATGGGMVTRAKNMDCLGTTGHIFFLDRLPQDIVAENHSGRPLVGDDGARIFDLYDARIDLYRKYATHRVADVTTPEEAADYIVEIWKKVSEQA